MHVSDFPDLPAPLKSALLRATVHQHEGQLFEANALYRQLSRQIPLHPLTAHSVGGFELLKGDLSAAWAMSEHRLNLPYYTHRPFAGLSAPYWTGAEMPGADLLVFSDLGLGDAILLARFMPWVAGRVGRVHFHANEGTAAFWRRQFPDAEVRELNDPLPDCDARINMFCLPRVYGATAENMPRAPYIAADDAAAGAWRAQLRGRFKVGLSWQGNPDHVRDFERSIPLAALLPLIADPGLRDAGVVFHSMQVAHGRDQLAALPEKSVMVDLGDAIMAADDPLGASADLIAELDLVIAIDSALANLAGAMDRPFWLPTYRIPDWRWQTFPDLDMAAPAPSPWYGSARLFTCRERGNWDDVIADMRTALLERAAT
tara:strand:- start:33772 stop:34890 length:1119 start_codon:yes stop_codon:yes gene_type:complete